MKKGIIRIAISSILVIIMLMQCFPVFAFSGVDVLSADSNALIKFNIEDVSGKPGDTVEVKISVSGEAEVSGLLLHSLTYDESALEFVKFKSGALVDSSLTKDASINGKTITLGYENNIIPNGEICTAVFSIKSTAEDGEYTIGFSRISASNNGREVSSELTAGTVTVSKWLVGDFDENGIVDMRDAVHFIGWVNFSYIPDLYPMVYDGNKDFNDDGTVDMQDAVYLIGWINFSFTGLYDIDWYGKGKCNHSMQHISAKAATCTEEGNIEYWYCDECGKYFSDAEGKTEITAGETVLAKTGHIEVIDAAVSPTYDSTGLTEGSHCSKCGKILKNQDVIPKLEATYHSIIYKDTKGAEIPVDKMRYSEHEGILDLPVISADGYTFKGWYTASEGGAKVDHITKGSNEDKVLYAHWELVEYDIIYKHAANNSNPLKYTIESEIVLSSPDGTGMSFSHWTDRSGEKITKIEKGTTGNLEIIANWKSIKNMAIPTTDNEDFIIVYDEKNARYHLAYEIGTIHNVVLAEFDTFPYDKLTGNTFTISKKASVEEGNAKTVAQTIAKSVATTTAWSNTIGWARNKNGMTTEESTLCPEIEISGIKAKIFERSEGKTESEETSYSNANYTGNTSDIGGETSDSVSSTVSYVKKSEITVTKAFTFDPSITPVGVYSYVYAGDVRVYAIITYDPNDGKYYTDIYSIVYRTFERMLYEPDPTLDSDINVSHCESLSFNIPIEKLMSKLSDAYYIKYDANDGDGEMPTSVFLRDKNLPLLPNQYTREGYIFGGWKHNTTIYFDNAVVCNLGKKDETIVLYAQWIRNKYKVKLDVNGGDALNPDTYEVTYDTEYGTLPSPVRAGYSFDGWYLGDEKIDSKSIVKMAGDHTLKAKWTEISYLVRFDAMGGSVSITTKKVPCASTYGELPVASREGYKFKGWFTDSLYGNEITSESATRQDCDPLPVTLYAKWEPIEYMVKIWASDCCSMPYSYKYDQDVILSWSEVKKNQLGDGWNFDGWYYGETMFDYQQFISRDEIVRLKNLTTEDGATIIIVARCNYNGSESPTQPACITENTLITLADGSQVAVKDLTGSEELLVWNMITGTFDSAPILFIDSDPTKIYEVITLTFSDNTTMEVISEHGFFDINLNCYVYLDRNASQYIGHWFNRLEIDEEGMFSNKSVQLVDVKIINKVEASYSPITYEHFCYYTNGLLSMPGGITGFFNIFSIDDDVMKYNEKLMKEDIDKYGLFTYEEFFELVPVPKKIFDALGGKYLKVSIGKGLITVEKLIKLAERYQVFFEN